MNQLEIALAAMPASEAMKIRAFAARFGDDLALEMLQRSRLLETKAIASGVAYKTTKPQPKWTMDDLSAYLLDHPTHAF